MENIKKVENDDDEQLFWSDEEDGDDEHIFWSDPDDEGEPLPRTKCIGCPHIQCDKLMPQSGTVFIGSHGSVDVLDYLYFVREYMTREGLNFEFECRSCQDCSKCKPYEANLLPITHILTTGLKGGARDEVNKYNQLTNLQSVDHLKLLNEGTDCFVNSTLQLLSNTGYTNYLTTVLPPLLEDAPFGSYRVSRALTKLYNSMGKGLISTAHIRKCVAEASGKLYLDINTQEDAEEFLSALEAIIAKELQALESFKIEKEKHWGKQTVEGSF